MASKNKGEGYALLVSWAEALAGGEEIRYCMESTGGYELGIACYLASTGRYVSVENPRFIKYFAAASGQSNKTDIADARGIAAYALAMEPRPWRLSQEDRRACLLLLRHRENLVADRSRVRNRLEHEQTLPDIVRKQLHAQDLQIAEQIEELQKELERVVERSQIIGDEVRVLTGFKGIAYLTAATIISEMPDVRLFNKAEDWAAQAGMFPCRRQSGKWTGQTRMSKFGNAHVRRILYMGATRAMQQHPAIKALAERLKAKGKKPKQIRVACMRKLLLTCYGALKAHYEGRKPFYGLAPTKMTVVA
jgi:transposase